MTPESHPGAGSPRNTCDREEFDISVMDAVLQSAIDQARLFLKEMGEFFPYASVVDNEGNVRPYGLYVEEDEQDARHMLQVLRELLDADLDTGVISVYVIATNVSITGLGEGVSSDAVEFRLRRLGQAPHSVEIFYMRYTGEGEDLRYEDLSRLGGG